MKYVLYGTLATMVTLSVYITFLQYDLITTRTALLQVKEELELYKTENKVLNKQVHNLRSREITPKGILQSHLNRMIVSTLRYLGEKNVKDWQRLILLTIVTESNMGCFTKQVRGPARGIVQIEPATERETLDWLKVHKPQLYKKIKDLRVPARLGIHECEYNNAYSIAMCYAVYLWRNVSPKGDTTALATLYKKHYNTFRGKATVPGVLAKLDAYGVRL